MKRDCDEQSSGIRIPKNKKLKIKYENPGITDNVVTERLNSVRSSLKREDTMSPNILKKNSFALLLQLLILVIIMLPLLSGFTKKSDVAIVYIGTFSGGKSQGIYACRLNYANMKLEPLGAVAEMVSPSFVAIHPNQQFLYSVAEMDTGNGNKTGAVAAFSIDPNSGKLKLLNKVSAHGGHPCYVSMDHSGKSLLAASYNTGSIAVCPIMNDGRLGEATESIQYSGSSINPQRQEGPHAHSINVSPDNRFALAADLGQDKIFVYHLDAENGKLIPNEPPFISLKPGAGPRHFAFHPSGKFLYSMNELYSTVTVFAFDSLTGATNEIETVTTLPNDFTEFNKTAEILVHPTGRFLYGSNRGHDSIVVYAIEQSTGRLTLVDWTSTQGKTPRNFGIDPKGEFLIAANKDTDSIVLFKIAQESGKLIETGQKLEIPTPVCVRFLMQD